MLSEPACSELRIEVESIRYRLPWPSRQFRILCPSLGAPIKVLLLKVDLKSVRHEAGIPSKSIVSGVSAKIGTSVCTGGRGIFYIRILIGRQFKTDASGTKMMNGTATVSRASIGTLRIGDSRFEQMSRFDLVDAQASCVQ